MNKVKNFKYYKLIKFFVIEGMYLILIDFFNQSLVMEGTRISEYIFSCASLFSMFWFFSIFIILYMLKPLYRKICTVMLDLFLLIFSIANYFLYSYFTVVVSWRDMALSGEGVSFLSSIFKYINLEFILFLLVCIFLMVCILKLKTKNVYKFKSKQSIVIAGVILGLLLEYGILKNSLADDSNKWSLDNDATYYSKWLDSTNAIRVSGTYEYLVRDFYFSFIKKDDVIKAKIDVDKYISSYNNNDTKNYTGIFKDKNVIFIMMESMDDWLVNKDVTPVISHMMKHGFNFVNHYSPTYVTGPTANTEFMVNTGIYPYLNKVSPYYAYTNNGYPFSMANLFKNEDYIVNSFHRSSGSIYNRGKMHINLGYDNYHDYSDMGIDKENMDLDSYIVINGYDKMIFDDKFMSFIITYSPHSPYTYNKLECQNNLEEIKMIYPNEENEEILCAYSAARETDNMVKLLLEKLEEDKLLDDTVIVMFSDHPNNLVIRDDETSIINKTLFYIYDYSMSENKIDTISSSINILPTIINLFGIKTDYIYPGYDILNTDNDYVIFRNYTYYDGQEIRLLTEDMYKQINYSANILISDYYGNK